MPAPTCHHLYAARPTLSRGQRLRRHVLLGAILALEVVVLGNAGASVVAPSPRPSPIT